MKAELEISGSGHGRVVLDGNDVSNGVRGVNLRAAVGDCTTLELDLAIFEGARLAGDVQVVIPEGTREALVALGWTPPEE